jgi:hypothetical protein
MDREAADEQTFDGLFPLRNTRADAAWARPDLDLSGYNKVMLVGAGISYRPAREVRSASTAFRRGQSEFVLDENQQARLKSIVAEAFLKELGQSQNFTIVEKPGADVLLIRGALLDVVSQVPPEPIGRGQIYLSSIGEATLVLEIRDSMSNTILVRAVDRRAAENIGPPLQESNRVTNSQEIRRLANHWARLLRQRLDEFLGS